MNTLKLNSRKRKDIDNCPCGRSNKDGKFVPYVGHKDCGYCHSCGQTFLPKLKQEQSYQMKAEPIKQKKIDYYPLSEFEKYKVVEFKECSFVIALLNVFKLDKITIRNLLHRYKITPSIKDNKRVVFWYIDINQRVRTGKIVAYDSKTGKRNKDSNMYPFYTKIKGKSFKRCFYGEHLLNKSTKPVAIVEAEKTAIIMSAIDERYIWVATGGKNFNWNDEDVYKALFGRYVVLFPDLGEAFQVWRKVAKDLKFKGLNVKISDGLERIATDEQKKQGLDLVDFIVL